MRRLRCPDRRELQTPIRLRSAVPCLPTLHRLRHLRRQCGPPEVVDGLRSNCPAPRDVANSRPECRTTSCSDFVDRRAAKACERLLTPAGATQAWRRDNLQDWADALLR